MEFSKAKQEFQIRYYQWATTEFDQEISEFFPNLGLFKTGSAWATVQFMRQLNNAERRILAQGLLKRFHLEATKVLGEAISDEECSLLSQRDAFCATEDAKSITRSRASKGVKFASKARLRRTILTKFKAKFGGQCFGLELVGLDPELNFQTKQCGWHLNTRFEFNGAHRQIFYWHNVFSPTTSQSQGLQTMLISRSISIHAWLGIASQTQWEHLTDPDIESACDAAIKFCGRFFDIAPKLLKGLEFDKITAGYA